MLKRKALEHLNKLVLPFWKSMRDLQYGGYYGFVDSNRNLNKEYKKGGILNSRILWFFSAATVILKRQDLLEYADQAYSFFKDYLLDKENNGIYWSVNYDGSINETLKHTYNQAFAIYSLVSYYEASHNKEALDLAYSLFDLIEAKCKDSNGYLESFYRDFTIMDENEELSENGVNAHRTMNTHLHVLEAFSELYRTTNDQKVKKALLGVLDIFENKIYNKELKRLDVFFDNAWNPIIDLNSYGHNIEATWLIQDAYNVLGAKAPAYLNDLLNQTLAEAYNDCYLYNEKEKGIISKKRIWWVECETVVALVNAYQSTLNLDYLDKANKTYSYLMNNFIDKNKNSEWINELDENDCSRNLPIVSEWKCPYHNGRMLLELIKRNVIAPANPNLNNEGKALLNYFGSIENKKIITGQHTQTVPQEELKYIYDITGKRPLLTGYELLGYSPNINPESDEICLTEVRENKNTLEVALNDDGIVELSWHWFSPMYGKGKAFYAQYTEFNPEKVLCDSLERKAFYKDLDYMASLLSKFNKPVLWRPFHEAEGTWFWWGSKGPEVAKKLYILMYDYFTNYYHLNNLIWVWSAPVGYPGDDYVDIIGWDVYIKKHQQAGYKKYYNKLIKNTTSNKLVALTECGVLPNPNKLNRDDNPWIYFMNWSKEFIIGEEYNTKAAVKAIYQSKNSITK